MNHLTVARESSVLNKKEQASKSLMNMKIVSLGVLMNHFDVMMSSFLNPKKEKEEWRENIQKQ